MFAKKQSFQQISLNMPASFQNSYSQSVFQSKHLNHDFFLLVRDQHYEQAYSLGQKILKNDPTNQAVINFCDFIKNNFDDLEKMVEYQRDYQTDDEEQEQQDESVQDSQEESQQEQEQQVSSKASSISGRSSVSSKGSLKSAKTMDTKKTVTVNSMANKQNAHKWQHNCKNPNCPNKKPHKHPK